MKKDFERMTYAIDLDNTLTQSTWWPGMPDPEPKLDRIRAVNDLYNQTHVIFIWTARKEEDRATTEAWLAKHKVRYHALVMNKLAATVYVDDRAVSDVDFFRDDGR